MSFAPYNPATSSYTAGVKQDHLMYRGQPSPIVDNIEVGNNDTKMSNNEAFLAFLQKNEEQEE